MASIDNILNRITMYRLVLYSLVSLIFVALALGFFKVLPQSPVDIAFSTLLILFSCWATNYVFAKTFNATPNVESVYITAFILALLISPVNPSDFSGFIFPIFASVWAMASKYIIALNKKHIFNPAALGVAISTPIIGQSASWWVAGNLALFPFVLLFGLLIVRKLRHFDLVLTFSAVTLLTTIFTTTNRTGDLIIEMIVYTPLVFFASVMLTEPLTAPQSRPARLIYGALVGLLFAPNIHLGSFYLTPELALLVGNVFAYFISPKGRYVLSLLEKNNIATDTYEFVFSSDRPIRFLAGQYLEWTLGHSPSDSRGNRRYFTIASSPLEPDGSVRLGVKFNKERPSSFKQSLISMSAGSHISATSLAGDFVLPRNRSEKLVFIAGGIGITPFRSHLQYLIDKKDVRDIVLLYSNKTQGDIAYRNFLDKARKELGLKVLYAITDENGAALDNTHYGFIDSELIAREVPDYKNRKFYLSGPRGMVVAFKKTLRQMGVPRTKIKTDYFPGFA